MTGIPMLLEERQDLALYYTIKNKFEDLGLTMTIVDSFVDPDYGQVDGETPQRRQLVLPSIAIDGGSISTSQFELGNRKGNDLRVWHIDIVAENKTQRNKIAYTITNHIQSGLTVYNYDQTDPSTWEAETEVLGMLHWRNLEFEPIPVMPELVSKMYWRGQIRLVAEYSKPSNP